MAQPKIDPITLKLLHKYKQRLSEKGFSVNQLILFGSHAKGKATPDSDIDIAVVSPALGKDTIEEFVTLRMLSRDLDLRIEPHPFSPKDFSLKEDPFAQEIRTTGIPI